MTKMAIKNILITGCGGMLGSAMYPHMKSKGYKVFATDIDLNENWLSRLDVREFDKSREIALKFKPDIILHLAALTSLEYCEEHPEESYETNFVGTVNMAKICKEMDIPLVYISTAGIFDGRKDRYTEKDSPNPINVYGRTKFYAEIAVENMLSKYFITRAGWMVGGGKKDHKFVSYMVSQAMQGNKVFNVVNDKWGTPTYTKDFANNLEALFKTDFYGKYHMVCEGNAHRADIARYILDTLGIQYKLNEVDSAFFQKQFPVARPRCEALVNENLKSINLNLMRSWKSAINDYLNDQWKDLISKKAKSIR